MWYHVDSNSGTMWFSQSMTLLEVDIYIHVRLHGLANGQVAMPIRGGHSYLEKKIQLFLAQSGGLMSTPHSRNGGSFR